MSSRQIGTTTESRRAPKNTLHAHARAKPKTPKSASAVLRLSTTHGPKVRPIVPLALHCRNISQGLIGMGSMPLRYQLHTYFPSARCRCWFRQCCHTKREEREGGMRETLSDRVVVVEDARYTLINTLTHTHILVLSRGHIMTGRQPAKRKCNREEKVMRRPARMRGSIGPTCWASCKHTQI